MRKKKFSSRKLTRKSRNKLSNNFLLLFVLLTAIIGIAVYFFVAHNPGIKPQAATRDPYLWPFDKNSPWNMPIGSGAQLVPANLGTPSGYFTEKEYVYTDANAPVRNLMDNAKWPATCGGGSNKGQVRIPDGILIEQGGASYKPNNAAGALKSDNTNIQEFLYASRCDGAGDVYTGLTMCSHSIYGSGGIGQYCGHGGSGLSAVGGSLRAWEQPAGTPIRHALKVTLPASTLNNDADSAECNDGKRWPANMADTGWNQVGHVHEYKGTVKDLCSGSLLTLPASIGCQNLVSGEFERRICQALQDYGAYVVDVHPTTGDWRPFALNGEPGANLNSAQMITLFQNLHVVVNNKESSVGGGGTPRVPLAPDFGQTNSFPTPTPTPTSSSQLATPTPILSPAPSTSPVASIEGETMTINSGYVNSSGNVFSDSSASAGKGLSLLSNGNASGTLNSGFNTVKVRAKADLCNGLPRMIIKVDGSTVMNQLVTSANWKDYVVGGLTKTSGNHIILVNFSNDYNSGACDRNLRIDKVSVETVMTSINRCDVNSDGNLTDADKILIGQNFGTVNDVTRKYDLNNDGTVSSGDSGAIAQAIYMYPTPTQYCY